MFRELADPEERIVNQLFWISYVGEGRLLFVSFMSVHL